MQKQGGYQRDTWQRCSLPGMAVPLCTGNFPAETELLGPFVQVPAQKQGLLSPSRGVTRHRAELQQECRKQPVCLPAQHFKIIVLQRNFSLKSCLLICLNFSLAVLPALPVNYKPLRKCCVDIVRESDQTVTFLLMAIKREYFNLYQNYTAQWFMSSEGETGLQMFLCEHLDMLG